MGEFLHARRWQKRNRPTFYKVILLVDVMNIQYVSNGTFYHKNYAQRLDLAQTSL